MNEKGTANQILEYASPENRHRRSLWPPITTAFVAAALPFMYWYAPFLGHKDDYYWIAALVVALAGVFRFALLNDNRGVFICLTVFSLLLAIGIALPTLTSRHRTSNQNLPSMRG